MKQYLKCVGGGLVPTVGILKINPRARPGGTVKPRTIIPALRRRQEDCQFKTSLVSKQQQQINQGRYLY
jgi:hypothetical protein